MSGPIERDPMSGPIERDPLALSEPEAPGGRTVPIKVNPEGRCSLAHPMAEPGGRPHSNVVREVYAAEVASSVSINGNSLDELGPGRLWR